QAVPEAPVDLHAEVGRALEQRLERLGADADHLAGQGGDGVGGALVAADETSLAEQIARSHAAEHEGAVGGRALQGGLAALQDGEVLPLRMVAVDLLARVVLLLLDGAGEAEDLLVREVRAELEPAQAPGELEAAGLAAGRGLAG